MINNLGKNMLSESDLLEITSFFFILNLYIVCLWTQLCTYIFVSWTQLFFFFLCVWLNLYVVGFSWKWIRCAHHLTTKFNTPHDFNFSTLFLSIMSFQVFNSILEHWRERTFCTINSKPTVCSQKKKKKKKGYRLANQLTTNANWKP